MGHELFVLCTMQIRKWVMCLGVGDSLRLDCLSNLYKLPQLEWFLRSIPDEPELICFLGISFQTPDIKQIHRKTVDSVC